MSDERNTARQQAEAQLIARAQQDPAFRQELIADPKAVFARELGVTLPDSIRIEVLEETPAQVYLILPRAVAQPGTQLSEAELEGVSGGWSEDTICGTFVCASC